MFDPLVHHTAPCKCRLRHHLHRKEFVLTKFIQRKYELPQSKICSAAELSLLTYKIIYMYMYMYIYIYIYIYIYAQLRQIYIHKKIIFYSQSAKVTG